MIILKIKRGRVTISDETEEGPAKNFLLKLVMELDLRRGGSKEHMDNISRKGSLMHPNGEKYFICKKEDVSKVLKKNHIVIDKRQ